MRLGGPWSLGLWGRVRSGCEQSLTPCPRGAAQLLPRPGVAWPPSAGGEAAHAIKPGLPPRAWEGLPLCSGWREGRICTEKAAVSGLRRVGWAVGHRGLGRDVCALPQAAEDPTSPPLCGVDWVWVWVGSYWGGLLLFDPRGQETCQGAVRVDAAPGCGPALPLRQGRWMPRGSSSPLSAPSRRILEPPGGRMGFSAVPLSSLGLQ